MEKECHEKHEQKKTGVSYINFNQIRYLWAEYFCAPPSQIHMLTH